MYSYRVLVCTIVRSVYYSVYTRSKLGNHQLFPSTVPSTVDGKRWRDRQRQVGRQAGRQIDRQIDRQKRHSHRYSHSQKWTNAEPIAPNLPSSIPVLSALLPSPIR